ncbi:non-ribosomal peptide synthetase [Chondromyces apiculatus]|nr:non-ribosomal peptide synthetase [Chondromyces apiculatus]
MTSTHSSDADACVHQLFERQAARLPDAVAITFGTAHLTYGELNRQANRLAHRLKEMGVGTEVLVGLCVERSIEALVGLIAVLKAGGAYVPIDPAYPPDRVAFMLEDAAVPVLLTQARLAASLPPHGAKVVLLDEACAAIASPEDDGLPDLATDPDRLAYVIYTSGSTGRPKGAQLTHRGVVNLALAQQAVFREVGPGSRVLQFASLSFDASVWEILLALTTGATLVMGSRAAMMPGPALVEFLRTEAISSAVFMASALSALPEGAEDMLPALHTLVVSGEACRADLAARWSRGRRFFNVYGPTEASCVTTMAECVAAAAAPPIGGPIPRTTCVVLDAALRMVPDGEPGELYIGGVGIARGYLRRPALTASRFIPDLFGGEPGARLYRTGDLVRRLPDGALTFLGRVDSQVKIRGFRVELEEIEAVIARHPAVRAAAVVVRSTGAYQDRLVAYIVARTGEGVAGASGAGSVAEKGRPQRPTGSSHALSRTLRESLRASLPEPMIPSAFVVLDALPLTAGGKLDRAALPDVGPERPTGGEDLGLPRNEVEATIAAIWAEVLGIERVGMDEDLFELGAHSLLVARVLSRLRSAFSTEIPLHSMFASRTVSSLARSVQEQRGGASRAAPVFIPRTRRDGPLPLSHGQRQIWVHAGMTEGARFYNEPFSIRLPGALDVPAFRRALDEMVRRHEIWRTTFTKVSGEPVQRIGAPAPMDLTLVDLRQLPEETRWARALALATDEARAPFDLEQGPLLRATLVRLGEADQVLFMTAHHIVMDGVSLFEVLPGELRALYQAFARGEPSPLPELPIQYADVALWQREQQAGGALASKVDYWKKQLAGLPTMELPFDRPRPVAPSHRGARQCVALSRELSLRVKTLAREQGVTVFVVLLAAFKALLFRHVRQDEIVVGTFSSNRDRPETEGLLGFFLNTLVLRTDLRGDPTFGELVRRVRDVSLEALTHQDVPFSRLVEVLQPARVPGRNPLFQAAFVLEPPAPSSDDGWSMSQLDVDTGASKFDLTLELDEREEGIIGRVEYSTDLFDAETIARMVGHYETLLDGATRDAACRVAELPLLTPAEQRMLDAWSTALPGPGHDVCVHRLFEEQVERSPEAIAVMLDNGGSGVESITYRELNRRANQLAHRLVRLGVSREDRVAVCMYRSVEMVVALLAVLKAGLVYVPLDPAYPTERIAFMLDQARAGILLTQARIGDILPGRLRVLCLDTDWDDIGQESGDDLEVAASPDQLAYVIYTSGSTGRPKGVAVPHEAIARLVKGTNYAHFGPEEVFLQFAPVSFDAATFEIWAPLLNGGRLVVMPPTTPAIDELLRVIREHGVTTVFFTTGLFHVLVEERLQDMRALRQILAGGDVMSPQHISRVVNELPGCRMVHVYGPTETTTFACSYHVTSAVRDIVPIGHPIPGTRMHVLDEQMRIVPAGGRGELYIGGEGLARGYWGRPDLTAERFVPDPTGLEKGGRLYRTGDKVRLTSDGKIEFHGRIDHQVKVRGFRIELGEIETVLSAHPGVRDAVVAARPDHSGEKRLVAYVVPHPDAATSGSMERSILDYLQPRLPDYMLPSAIVVLDALPLTPSHKVNRSALPAPEEYRPADKPVVAPRSQLEEQLAALWKDVLGLKHVGVHDNFFDLGGHSLILMRLHERIRETLSVSLSIVDIFARPTIGELATFLASGDGGGNFAEADARARKQREILKRKKLTAAQAKSKPHGSA